ncbi:hypothetical protein L7F22_021486 [Adiantum nelumboides]|nr:hypothetical protein [Adiantum nelumboides]
MIWYFDSGASRHITSRKDLFCSLDAAPTGKKVTCTNNASYPIKGVGKILITISDGSDLCLPDVLYVPRIKKNLLSVSSLAKNGLRVIFEDDRCIVQDRENGYSLITIGTLENGLFVLDRYEKQIQACIAKTKTQAMQDAELWHARFGHVGYGNLMTLQRHNMVHDLSLLEMPPRHLRGKLDDKAVKCIFVGHSSGSKGYRLYNPATNKIFESRDVIFVETTAQPMVAFDVPHMQTQDVFEGFLPSFMENQESQQVDNFDQSFDQHVTPHDVEKIVREEQEILREERTLPKWVQKTLQDSKLDTPLPRKTRAGTTFGREQVDLACFSTLCDADEPDSFEQALECVQWKDAMQQEIDSIHKNHTWDLVDLLIGKKPIGTKWVFKVKRKQNGIVDRYKARLVVKGYAQQKGIDYDETFAPTSCASTIRSLVAIAAHHNWKVHQSDIKTAFLNGDLQEEVYVSQPSGFVVKGQEQKAPRAWYEKIHTYLIGQGFQNSPTESTLYVKKIDAILIMLTLYVDDMLLTGNNENENAAFKDALQKTFEMSDLGLLHYYLGI